MDVLIDPTTADYAGQRITTLANAVYLRLETPLGSYWADPALGSRLHELQREKDLTRVYTLARQYAEQALAPLIEDGRAQRITVTATRLQPGWCLLQVEVVDQGGVEQVFTHHVKVA
ncbi:phage GP46 family protein [Bordetella bronchiseptica]|uniref:phage GP46 family protein n=1 Tax=Bordetella bronchiseptica TaxID=518 RepID=UPI000460B3B2|nr:phage GP46 family protein [Bordetella bronchiseptica]KDC65761.1 putative phage protein GP46 [Bordetella bronchiseptica MBORD591]